MKFKYLKEKLKISMENKSTANLIQIQEDLNLIKSIIINQYCLGGWIPKKFALKYLDYSNTKFYELIESKEIVISKIGRRYFVQKQSLIDLINRNKK